jgi:plasmid stabilization system protein ParE
MMTLSPLAEAQLDALMAHYEAQGDLDASIELLMTLERARRRISNRPQEGMPAPRFNPGLAKAGRRWIVDGGYWISYSLTTPPVISGVFFAMGDVSDRS